MISAHWEKIDCVLQDIKDLSTQAVSYEEKVVLGYQLQEIFALLNERKSYLVAGLKGVKDKEQSL